MENTKGQMHVLEVLLVGVLFTSAVNVAVNILQMTYDKTPNLQFARNSFPIFHLRIQQNGKP